MKEYWREHRIDLKGHVVVLLIERVGEYHARLGIQLPALPEDMGGGLIPEFTRKNICVMREFLHEHWGVPGPNQTRESGFCKTFHGSSWEEAAEEAKKAGLKEIAPLEAAYTLRWWWD